MKNRIIISTLALSLLMTTAPAVSFAEAGQPAEKPIQTKENKSKNNYSTTFNVTYAHNGSTVESITFGYHGYGITINMKDKTSSTSASGTVKYAKS